MNIKYAGNADDMFKFDLITHLAGAMRYSGITYIPMPTQAICSGKRKTTKNMRGTDNLKLSQALQNIRGFPSYFDNLRNYFKLHHEIAFQIHKPDAYISKTSDLANYFDELAGIAVNERLVFADPDSGLEPQKRTIKHLSYYEVCQIIAQINKNSVFMIYQRSPRDAKLEYLYGPNPRCKQIHNRAAPQEVRTCWIRYQSTKTHFIFCAKNKKTAGKVREVLQQYTAKHKGLKFYVQDL